MNRPRIGFAFDQPHSDKSHLENASVEAEYEDQRTLDWMRDTLGQMGEVIDLPWGSDIISDIPRANPDIVFNITEGQGGRNRESLVPAIAEAYGIPFTGSDALCLGMALDKSLTKIVAGYGGIPTPAFVKVSDLCAWDEHIDVLSKLKTPLIVKPNCGGSSQGITSSSKVYSVREAREIAAWVLDSCADAALVEEFVPGREYGFGIMETTSSPGDPPSRMSLPLAEIRLPGDGEEAYYSFEKKQRHDKEILCPADVAEQVAGDIAAYSHTLFLLLGCRDLARVDFRLSRDGVPYFLEINPLPGLSPYYGIYTAQAKTAGIEPEEIVFRLVNNALQRRGR